MPHWVFYVITETLDQTVQVFHSLVSKAFLWIWNYINLWYKAQVRKTIPRPLSRWEIQEVTPSSRKKTLRYWLERSVFTRHSFQLPLTIRVSHSYSFNSSIFVDRSGVHSSALTSFLSIGHTFLSDGPFPMRQRDVFKWKLLKVSS